MVVKRPSRDVVDELVRRGEGRGNEIAMGIAGDNELVIKWLDVTALCDCPHLGRKVAASICRLRDAWAKGLLVPRVASTDCARHVYRELNKEADALAKYERV